MYHVSVITNREKPQFELDVWKLLEAVKGKSESVHFSTTVTNYDHVDRVVYSALITWID